jgi:YidC/Oxa1 family membrane protein insertase
VERRFAIFLVITILIWVGFFFLQATFGPQQPPVAKQANKKPPDKAAAEKKLLVDAPPAAKTEDDPPPAAAPAAVAQVPAEQGFLGSLDPATGYRMLVTWNNHGAVIERVELNDPRYKSIEDFSGYLGHVELTSPKSGGAEVTLVGPGTPAALAKTATPNVQPGLLPGDVIQQVDGKRVADRRELEDYLRDKTRPGQKVILTVTRQGAAKDLDFTVELTRRPLEVVRPESHRFKTDDGGIRSLPQDPLSLLLTLDNIGGRGIRAGDGEMAELPSLYDSNWTVEKADQNSVEFSFTLDEAQLAKINKTGALKIFKKYTLAKNGDDKLPGFHLDMQVAIQNLGQQEMPVGYRLDGPTSLPLEGWWYSTKLHPEMWKGAGARDVAWSQTGHRLLGGPAIVSQSKTLIKDQRPPLIPLLAGDEAAPLHYIGVDTQFFASAVLPQPQADQSPIKFRAAYAQPVQDVNAIPKNWLRTANVSFRLSPTAAQLAPQEKLTHNYRVFFGPKDMRVLQAYHLDPLIEYGWRVFGYPAWWLQKLLEALHSVTKNYGIAIILLTVIVRTCMIPISLKQAKTAAKMQELAPEVQKIKDRFPDDALKQHAAVQELYKKHNFNMFGGCLPVFLQLPIFIGLYRCLSVNIELRDAPLIPGISWASNLAGPDKLFFWKDWMPGFIADEADGYLGPFFNVLPLITVALFLIQQKMITPPATDEQTKMQQQMMTYMTVFMGIMFYKVPAGLCLYFITSSLWGICERKLLPKSKPGQAASSSEGGGFLAKLAPKPASPNGASKDAVKEKLARRARQKR